MVKRNNTVRIVAGRIIWQDERGRNWSIDNEVGLSALKQQLRIERES